MRKKSKVCKFTGRDGYDSSILCLGDLLFWITYHRNYGNEIYVQSRSGNRSTALCSHIVEVSKNGCTYAKCYVFTRFADIEY